MARKIKIDDYIEKNNEQENKKSIKKDNSKICSLIINGVLAICTIVLLIMYILLNSKTVSKNEYDSVVNSKNSRINILEGESSNLNYLLDGQSLFYVKEKIKFFDDNIVFKIKGHGNYYYSYDCMMKKVNGSYEYWAYNKDAAISNGLKEGGC